MTVFADQYDFAITLLMLATIMSHVGKRSQSTMTTPTTGSWRRGSELDFTNLH